MNEYCEKKIKWLRNGSETKINLPGPHGAWKVLIVDDDSEVHVVTKMVLSRVTFDDKKIRFFSAYSGAEGKKILEEHPDIAVIFLDVVMESEDAGLQLARYIRHEMNNRMVRIVLRTGHPGQAPSERVIIDYEINDYKEKTELTTQKLYTSMIVALRSYRDLVAIDNNRKGLKKVIEASASIFELQSLGRFATGVLIQLVALLHLEPSALYCMESMFTVGEKGANTNDFYILAATGEFEKNIQSQVAGVVSKEVKECLDEAYRLKKNYYTGNCMVIYCASQRGAQHLIYFEGVTHLTEVDSNLLEIFAVNVSVALENIYLMQELEDDQKEVIFALVDAMETRALEPVYHAKRVSEIVRILAPYCGFDEREVAEISLAAAIHDVGTLGVAENILNKVGTFDEAEYAEMKKHSQIGHHLLKANNRKKLHRAADLALLHHERYDGSGYPAGLAGEEISCAGRLIAVADVFDALGNRRPYRAPWVLTDIIEYMKNQSGKHFDPQIVKVLLEHIDEVVSVRTAFPD